MFESEQNKEGAINKALDFMLTGQFLEEGRWDRYNIAKIFTCEGMEGSDGEFLGKKIRMSTNDKSEVFNILGNYREKDCKHTYKLLVLVKKDPVSLDFNCMRDNYNLNIDVLVSEEQNSQINRIFSLQGMVFECKVNIKLLTSLEEDYLQKVEITAEGYFSEIIGGGICNLGCLHSSEKSDYSDDPVSILLDFMLSGRFLNDGAWNKYDVSKMFLCEFMLGTDNQFHFSHYKKNIDNFPIVSGNAFLKKSERVMECKISIYPVKLRFTTNLNNIINKYSLNLRDGDNSIHQFYDWSYKTEIMIDKNAYGKPVILELILTCKRKTLYLIDGIQILCFTKDEKNV